MANPDPAPLRWRQHHKANGRPKVGYRSRRKAEKSRRGAVWNEVYPCDWCGRWHVASGQKPADQPTPTPEPAGPPPGRRGLNIF